MRTIDKYLSTRDEARAIADTLEAHEQVVVVPAYGEGELDALHASIPDSQLLILVVNEPPDAPDDKRALNRETLAWARERAHCVHKVFPRKQGVGAARAFGADVALAMHAQGKLGVPMIFMTDADAVLPSDYVSRVDADAAACIYPFVHEPLHPAITAYEIGLRYYVAGLRWAGSPYAFHTIGSCMAIHVEAYASMRGVPLRNAAEDFYLLNKVRKVGRVASLKGAPIRLSGRGSDRVPFGTGRAVLDYDGAPTLYDPRCFEAVRRARDALLGDEVDTFVDWGRRKWSAFDEVLAALELGAAAQRARDQTRSAEAREKHVDGWFDAFVQRKLVHRMRDACLPSPPLPDALRDAPFVDAPEGSLPEVLDAMRRSELSG